MIGSGMFSHVCRAAYIGRTRIASGPGGKRLGKISGYSAAAFSCVGTDSVIIFPAALQFKIAERIVSSGDFFDFFIRTVI